MGSSPRSAIEELLAGAEAIVAQCERAGRELNAQEAERFAGSMERVAELQGQSSPLADRCKLFRVIRYMAIAQGVRPVAVRMAQQHHDPEAGLILRAAVAGADSSTAAWAGHLVAPVVGEFIPLLRQRSALFALAPDPWPLADSVVFPRMSAGSASGFVKEGDPIPAKANTLESITLSAYKAAGLVTISAELMKRADRFAEAAVLEPLADDIALGVDQVFLSTAAAVAETSPAGIFHSSNAASAIAATVGGTAQACATDLHNLLAAGAAMLAPRLLVHPTALAAAGALSNSNTFAVIQALLSGRVGRAEVIEAANLPAVDTLALVDAAGLLVASDGLRIDASTEALIVSDTAPAGDPLSVASGGLSLWQHDMVSTAVKLGITWRSRRTAQVQWISGATWV